MVPQVEEIASRIRELREILEIDQDLIANKAGVERSLYADYEAGNTDIPIGKLYLIADALGVDPTLLLIGDNPRMVDYTLVRGGKGVNVKRYEGYSFTSLAYNFINRDMEPMIVHLDPTDKVADLVTHEGQEFNYVLEGSIVVTLKNNEYVLETGDSIYFNPALPHGQRCHGDVPAKFLTIINE